MAYDRDDWSSGYQEDSDILGVSKEPDESLHEQSAERYVRLNLKAIEILFQNGDLDPDELNSATRQLLS